MFTAVTRQRKRQQQLKSQFSAKLSLEIREARPKALLKSDVHSFLVLKGLSCAYISCNFSFVFLPMKKWEAMSGSRWDSDDSSWNQLEYWLNSNIPKPSSKIDVRCFTFLHVNYSSDLKTLQLNGAASHIVFSCQSKHQGTYNPWVQHSYELMAVPDEQLQPHNIFPCN